MRFVENTMQQKQEDKEEPKYAQLHIQKEHKMKLQKDAKTKMQEGKRWPLKKKKKIGFEKN